MGATPKPDPEPTEHKRSEEAVRESQRALSALMTNLPGLAYRCRNDRDWTMEFVSEGAIELTGYKASDFIGSYKIVGRVRNNPEFMRLVICHYDPMRGGDTTFFSSLLYHIRWECMSANNIVRVYLF